MEIDQMRVVREKRERATRDEPFLFLEFLAQLSPDAETLVHLAPPPSAASIIGKNSYPDSISQKFIYFSHYKSVQLHYTSH